eukprot:Hpha_TRINITY_DN13003_c0_g2::TRINITY_DN13003_c0_g2_i1::g.69198::m.69198
MVAATNVPSLRGPYQAWIPVVLLPTLQVLAIGTAIPLSIYWILSWIVGSTWAIQSLSLVAAAFWFWSRPKQAGPNAPSVVVIGAGFSGVNMAIQLKKRGYRVKLYEKSSGMGGTWFDNRYPGIACDIYSHLYSYSYAPNPDWSVSFSPGAEIQRYIAKVARDFGVDQCTELNTELKEAEWQAGEKRWKIVVAGPDGKARTEYTDVLVAAIGLFPQARMPQLDGTQTFEGKLLHSREWDASFDATGLKVAVVGTGASAVQIVPRIAQQAKELLVFQRTPGWIIPKQDYAHPGWLKALFRCFPPLLMAHRFYFWVAIEIFTTYALVPPLEADGRPNGFNRRVQDFIRWFTKWHIKRNGGSDELAEAVAPKGAFGNKRPALSIDFWPALCLPHVKLVPEAVASLTEDSIVTQSGKKEKVDAIIFATGYNMLPHPASHNIRGEGVTLAESYNAKGGHYWGMTTPELPNFFQLFGPGALGHNNLPTQAEIQSSHVVSALELMQERRAKVIRVSRQAQREYQEERQARLGNTVFHTTKSSWYLTPDHQVWTHHPGGQVEYWRRTAQANPAHYETE